MENLKKHPNGAPELALSVMVFSVGSFHEPIAWLQG